MDWKETRVQDERLLLVQEFATGERSRAEICRRYGVSRKTGYKWYEQFLLHSVAGLAGRSRKPLHHPNAVDEETAQPPARSARAQQQAFDRFRKEYDEQRPHEALAMVRKVNDPKAKRNSNGKGRWKATFLDSSGRPLGSRRRTTRANGKNGSSPDLTP